MKLKSLRIRNLLSIKDTTLYFTEQGVYHLFGKNNIGKSAIVKAIRALFMNVANNQYKEYLRDDCTTFTVEAKTWSGDTLKLSRGATDYYEWEIGGVPGRMDKTGGKVPDEVRKYVNMYVDDQKTKECLNVRLPRSVLTFVDTSAGDNAHLIQKALGTEEFLLSMRLSERKKREVAREVKVIEKYQEREEQKLVVIEGELSEEKSKLERVEDFERVLKQEYTVYKKIEEVVMSARDLQTSTDELEKAKSKLKDLDTKAVKQEIDDVKAIEGLLGTMSGMAKTNKEKELLSKKIEGVDTEELRRLMDEMRAIDATLVEGRELAKMKREVEKAKVQLEKSDKELGDFMRENKFCPIVARTLDKKCPFSMMEGEIA